MMKMMKAIKTMKAMKTFVMASEVIRQAPLFYFLFSIGRSSARAGFTLIETLVALTLIVSAMVGPFTLATSSIFSAKFSKSKLVALNLAQEGIEIVRQMRDNNVLKGFDWRGLSGSCPVGCIRLQDGSYQIDVYTPATGSVPPPNSNLPLRFDPQAPSTDPASLYNQNSGPSTPFTRVIAIETPAAAQMKIVSTVTWSDSGLNRQVTLQEVIYNWR